MKEDDAKFAKIEAIHSSVEELRNSFRSKKSEIKPSESLKAPEITKIITNKSAGKIDAPKAVEQNALVNKVNYRV